MRRLGTLSLATALISVVAGQAAADQVTVMGATLPSERYATSAVWDGQRAYVFGGQGGSYLSQIVRHTPETGEVTVVSALPTPRRSTSAVWDGESESAYVFGGYTGAARLSQIVRYTPATGQATVMSATLPSPRYGTSAAWDPRDNPDIGCAGGCAYVFGGFDGSPLSQIVRYTPATGEVTTLSTTLPSSRYYTSAVWDGESAYVFGGDGASGYVSQIVRYTPATDEVATDEVTVMPATLPTGRRATSAVWEGESAYVFGGYGSSGYVGQIVRYTPATGQVTLVSASLPSVRAYTSAVWDRQGAHSYVFAGHTSFDGVSLNQIVRYSPRSRVSLDPTSLSFGARRVGTSSAPQTLTVTNVGAVPLALGAVSIGGASPGEYAKGADTCSDAALGPGASCTIAAVFSPEATGARNAALQIPSDAPASPHTVALSGTGVQPEATLSPALLVFGIHRVGAQSAPEALTLTNSGTDALSTGPISIGGSQPADFQLTGDGCSQASLEPGEGCTVEVAFAPTAGGERTAALQVPSDAPGSPHEIALSGTGDGAPPASTFTTPNPAVLLRDLDVVEGSSEDDYAGVSSVRVTYRPLALRPPTTTQATLACATPLLCTWEAALPTSPGVYLVTARGTDDVGNEESPGPSILAVIV